MLHPRPSVQESTEGAVPVPGRRFGWLALAAAGAVTVLLLLVLVETRRSLPADRALELAALRLFGRDDFPAFSAISLVGGPWGRSVAAALTLVVLLLARLRWSATFLLLAQLGSAAGATIKLVVQRHRPGIFPGHAHAAGYSFPSGHALDATLALGALAYLAWVYRPTRGVLLLVAPVASLGVVLVALSRVVLGVHYPTDVAAGVALGVTWLALTIAILGGRVRAEAEAWRVRRHAP